MTFRVIAVLMIFFVSIDIVEAQTQKDLLTEVQTALAKDDLATALIKSDALYELALSQNDLAGAGKAAFSRAKIYAGLNKSLEAAKSYALCKENYSKIKAAAQSLHCQFESGKAYLAANRPGLGEETIENTEKALRAIGQEQSGLAALVYLELSEITLPTKLDYSHNASAKRTKSIRYAENAMQALRTSGQEKSELYMFALLSKGFALEDSKKYKDAANTFTDVIKLHKTLPKAPINILENAKIHQSISSHNSKKSKQAKKDQKTMSATDKSGNEVLLRVKKKKKVKFPRINKNQLIDGAQVKAVITLGEDGSVTNINITESSPKKEFGEAFAKAVKTWKFIPPEGTSGLDIPPFEYGMVFYVNRR